MMELAQLVSSVVADLFRNFAEQKLHFADRLSAMA
jgi:hypothetical protein